MTGVLAAIASVFAEFGWAVRTEQQLSARGFTADAIFESESAVVFCEVLAVGSLETKSERLSAEVAAAMQATSLSDKAWEGYLLLVCEGDLIGHERVVQAVQHDLTYCRKVVLSADEIARGPDPVATARRLLAFLFPLRQATPPVPLDVRQSLAKQLALEGIAPSLAAGLVANFDEPTCRCADRLLQFTSGPLEQDQ